MGADAPPEAALVVICLSGFREEAYAPPSLGSGAPRFLPGCALFQVLAGVQSTLLGPSIAFALGAWFASAIVMHIASFESCCAQTSPSEILLVTGCGVKFACH